MKPLYAKLLRRNKFLAQRAIALVLGLDTIYYYRGAARSATIVIYSKGTFVTYLRTGSFATRFRRAAELGYEVTRSGDLLPN